MNYHYDLYDFLVSIEKAKFTTEFKEAKIFWNLVKYPQNLIDINMSRLTKDKKKYNYCKKAKNYNIENNILYFTGYGGKTSCKLRIPFFNEKLNIITMAHSNNGNLGINRTISKVKENGYFWETMIEDVKSYIENCSVCILARKGKK